MTQCRLRLNTRDAVYRIRERWLGISRIFVFSRDESVLFICELVSGNCGKVALLDSSDLYVRAFPAGDSGRLHYEQ